MMIHQLSLLSIWTTFGACSVSHSFRKDIISKDGSQLHANEDYTIPYTPVVTRGQDCLHTERIEIGIWWLARTGNRFASKSSKYLLRKTDQIPSLLICRTCCTYSTFFGILSRFAGGFSRSAFGTPLKRGSPCFIDLSAAARAGCENVGHQKCSNGRLLSGAPLGALFSSIILNIAFN